MCNIIIDEILILVYINNRNWPIQQGGFNNEKRTGTIWNPEIHEHHHQEYDPDGADDDELMEIAEEDEESFEDACKLFAKLVKKYMKYGLYIDGEVYGATE